MDLSHDEERRIHQMNPKSEVVRLLQQITLDHEAAQRGLSGLAYGTAQHRFIEARTERIAEYSLTLRQRVGDQEAFRLLSEIEQQERSMDMDTINKSEVARLRQQLEQECEVSIVASTA